MQSNDEIAKAVQVEGEWMPVQYPIGRVSYRNKIRMSNLNEEWAQKIHGQSLAELANRGGLSLQEIVGNINKLNAQEIIDMTLDVALKEMRGVS